MKTRSLAGAFWVWACCNSVRESEVQKRSTPTIYVDSIQQRTTVCSGDQQSTLHVLTHTPLEISLTACCGAEGGDRPERKNGNGGPFTSDQDILADQRHTPEEAARATRATAVRLPAKVFWFVRRLREEGRASLKKEWAHLDSYTLGLRQPED